MNKILLKGREYPCRVTMGAMVRFKRASGRDVSQLLQTDVADLGLFLYCCVASASAADEVEFPYTFEQFADLVDPSLAGSFYQGIAGEDQKKTTTNPEAESTSTN